MRSPPAAGHAEDRRRSDDADVLWFNTTPTLGSRPVGELFAARALAVFPPAMLRFLLTRISAHRSDVHRDDAARVLPDPARSRRSDRDDGRRARHRSRAARGTAQGIRARSAGARPIRDLHRARAARRPRQVDDHAGAGRARVRDALSRDDRARALRDRLRARHRHSGRDDRRGAPQLGVRPRRDGRVADRLLDADLLVGAPADPPLLGRARLDAGVRPHRGQVLHRAGDGLSHDRCTAVGREGSVRIGGVAPDPADDRARHPTARHHRPDDALGDARGSGRGLHPHRAGQGPVATARRRAACVSQRADPGHHRHRAAGGRAVHRRDPDRDDLLLAGRGQVDDRGDQPARLSRAAGRPADAGLHRDDREFAGRCRLRRDQPADTALD